MSTAPRMLHVGVGPSPLREPLDRPRPRPVRVPPGEPVRRRSPAARARAARRRTAFLLFSGALVGALLFVLVSAQALVAQSAFRSEELRARTEHLQREQGRLRLRIAELRSPPRLYREALRQGMVLPEEVTLIQVPSREVSSGGSDAGKAPGADPAGGGALGANP